MKRCSHCKKNKPVGFFGKNRRTKDGYQHTCLDCNREYFRKYNLTAKRQKVIRAYWSSDRGREIRRKYNRLYREKYPEKRAALNAVYWAKSHGKLFSTPCEICGSKQVFAHHDDYSKKLEVRWLCREHHMHHHRIEEQK